MTLKGFAIYAAGCATVGLAWLATAILSDMDDDAVADVADSSADVVGDD